MNAAAAKATRAQGFTELRELFRLALPIAFAQAGNQLMSLVDTAVVARSGATNLAAVGLAAALFFSFFCFGIGLMLGLDPMISQALGAKDPVRARRLYWLGNRLAIGIAVVISVPMVLFPFILEPIGIDHALADAARSYLWWRIPGTVAVLWFMNTRGYLQAIKKPRALVVSTLIANVANYLFDVLLVFGGAALPSWMGLSWVPALGVAGAAIATVLCTFLQLGIAGWAVHLHRVPGFERGQGWELWAPLPAERRTMLKVGLPIGLHMLAEVGVFSLAGLLAARMGAASGSAHQVAINLASLTFCVAVGIGSAGSVRVGYAIGEGNTPAARRAGFLAIGAGAGFMGLCGLFMLAFPRTIVSWIAPDPAVILAAVPLMGVAAAFQIFDGMQGVGAGVLRGAGDSRYTFLANVAGHYGVGLPLALGLTVFAGMGVTGLWWGLCAGLIAVALPLTWRFHRLSSKPIRALTMTAATATTEAAPPLHASTEPTSA